MEKKFYPLSKEPLDNGSRSRCKDVVFPSYAFDAVSLSLHCDGLGFLVANNWVPSISSSGSHIVGIAWAILAIITMWSPIFHLLVALYRGFQILVPSLGTWWMMTQGRGMIPLCAPHIPLCAHIVSKEALVAILRRLHVRRNLSFALCGPGKGHFSTFRKVRLSGKKTCRRCSSRRIMHTISV